MVRKQLMQFCSRYLRLYFQRPSKTLKIIATSFPPISPTSEACLCPARETQTKKSEDKIMKSYWDIRLQNELTCTHCHSTEPIAFLKTNVFF